MRHKGFEGTLEDDAQKWGREFGRGSTRLALLALLDRKESYGYQILADLKQRAIHTLPATEAAVYPMLKDLEKKGLLEAEWKAVADGVPPRKYYRLTEQGTAHLALLKEAWTQYRKEMERILKGD